MRHLKIKEIGEVVSGSTPKTEKKEYWDGNINWVTPKELGQLKGKYLIDTERKITPDGFKSCSTRLIPQGNILFTSRAPIGHLAINSIEVCTNQGFKSIILKSEFAAEYVYYALKRNVQKLQDLGTGSTFKELSKGKFEEFILPVPSLPDQLHIANLLSKAESLIAQRKESIRLLDEFLKSTFLEMFGDPVRNEKGWEKDKVISYTDCIVPGRDKPKSFTGNTPWFTTEDLNHKVYVTNSKKGLGLSDAEIKEVRARVIPAGSVLITCVGDLGVISICKEDCVVNQQLHAFICKDEINNLFLMYSLSFQTNFMYKKATSTTVPYMNKTTCNSIPVIVPPIELQTQFAQIVEKTEALKTQYQQSLTELENLYGSLSQKAFKGELSIKNHANP